MCGGGDSAAIGENIRALFQRKQVVEFAGQSINVHRSEASIADSAIAFTVPDQANERPQQASNVFSVSVKPPSQDDKPGGSNW